MADVPPEEGTIDTLEFQAEVQQVLHILAHSLYTEREVFLRELISNASDALHRLQFEMLTNREVLDPEAEPGIWIEFDEEARSLTITDNGIGMTREELIENLGTIAHSGAMAFIQKLEEGQRPGEVIGQFGVGFYSVFMVAEEAAVTSRSYDPQAQAYTWRSRGESSYTLEPAEKEQRGTTIHLQLKEGAEEYASAWRLKEIIQHHSNFISFPIHVEGERVNQQQALWRRSPQEVVEAEYEAFYQQLVLDPGKPRLHLHVVTDVPVDIRALLFIPRKRETGMLARRKDHGLRLYNKNVLIQEDNLDLLPNHLRFLEGVVDSEDLPLNVSRETVQRNPALRRIQKALAGRVTRSLRELGEQDPEAYQDFWREFGYYLKEGIATDPLSRDDLLPLLRFQSSRSEGQLIALQDYAARMPADQKSIYYVLGESLSSVAGSPHLDYFQARDLEVLYLVDPLDGFVVQNLREYQGKPLQNVDDAGLELPAEGEGPEPQRPEIPEERLAGLLARIKAILGESISQVRLTRLLTNSPARLVSAESGPERDFQRLRRMIEEDFEAPPKIMEINPAHPLIQGLEVMVREQPDSPRLNQVIEQLFENLLLLEGLHPNPAAMVPRLQALLEAAVAPPDAGELPEGSASA